MKSASEFLAEYSKNHKGKLPIAEVMQEYASYRIEQLLDVEEGETLNEAIKYENYSKDDNELIAHEKSGKFHGFQRGAKWLLETLKNKANFIKCT